MTSITRRSLVAMSAAVGLATPLAAQPSGGGVALPGGGLVPALGQGSSRLGQGRRPPEVEEEALRTGLSLGMSCLDTAEIYGNGRSEELIGRVAAGRRDQVFLVSKVPPSHAASVQAVRDACTASLARLGTGYLDLYLLHWRGDLSDLGPMVAAFAELRREGRIRRWGVSNFRVADLEQLFALPGGNACAVNQVLYNLRDRRAEQAELPWCARRGVAVMAYSPLGNGNGLLDNPALARVAARLGVASAAAALAWTMRDGRTVAIPESGAIEHVRQNATAPQIRLTAQDLAELDAAFPA